MTTTDRHRESEPDGSRESRHPTTSPIPITRSVRQRGLHFEEYELGVVYEHRPGRTITEADDVLFTTLSGNSQSLHLDEHFAASQPFGRRLVNSMFTLSLLVGLSVAQLTEGTIVANLGFEAVEFPAPVFHGDTIYASTVVVGKRLSQSRTGQGIVTLKHTARNQSGAVVAVATRSVLVWCEDAHQRHENA